MKLFPALVPEPLWSISARRLLPRSAWDRIRKKEVAVADNSCANCGTFQDKGLICHEVWQYDDEKHVVTLSAFEISCAECDLVHHLGRAGTVGLAEQALERMVAVNHMSRSQAAAVISDAFAAWRRRSMETWSVSVAEDLLASYPELSCLRGVRGLPGDGAARVAERLSPTTGPPPASVGPPPSRP